MAEPQSLRRWDVICRVVDHYGDAGVCLRVARVLASLPGGDVRLLVDQPEVVLKLIQPHPAVAHLTDPQSGPRPMASADLTLNKRLPQAAHRVPAVLSAQQHDSSSTWLDRSGVSICGWNAPPREVDVVLETFGSELPPVVLQAMRTQKMTGDKAPVWLNLEHLSAEHWVEGCHGLPSPRAGGLTRWFLFPGFSHRTAGLPGPQVCLPQLPEALIELLRDPVAPGTTIPPDAKRSDGQPLENQALVGSVFCYRDSPLPALLDAMQSGPVPVRLVIPVGMPGDLGGRELDDAPRSVWQKGQLMLVRIPFVDQDLYDAVLAACDFNIVRGEDSFVRAQWVARPMLWAAYREPGATHLDKLAAWLEHCEMPPAWTSLHGWFNGGMKDSDVSPSRLWNEAINSLGAADNWAKARRGRLLTLPRLADTLVDFALQHAQQIQ